MPITDTGIAELERDLALPSAPDLVLELRNTAEYAAALQDLEGYFVIDEAHFLETVTEHIEALFGSGLPLTEANLRLALDAAGKAEVNYLRSLTNESRPAVDGEEQVAFTTGSGERVSFVANRGASSAERQAHPGHWADDTGLLAGAYESEVL